VVAAAGCRVEGQGQQVWQGGTNTNPEQTRWKRHARSNNGCSCQRQRKVKVNVPPSFHELKAEEGPQRSHSPSITKTNLKRCSMDRSAARLVGTRLKWHSQRSVVQRGLGAATGSSRHVSPSLNFKPGIRAPQQCRVVSSEFLHPHGLRTGRCSEALKTPGASQQASAAAVSSASHAASTPPPLTLRLRRSHPLTPPPPPPNRC
jgi:hypothetical protein